MEKEKSLYKSHVDTDVSEPCLVEFLDVGLKDVVTNHDKAPGETWYSWAGKGAKP
jgi:hypothetical protein